MENKNLEFKFDLLSFIGLILTIISITLSYKLSFEATILSIGILLIILSTYFFISMRTLINDHAQEIQKLNEKINIYKNISELQAKVELLMRSITMEKGGRTDFIEVLIRLIQILAIFAAGYLIFKALGAF